MYDLAIVSVRRLLGDKKGISAIEYGVLGAVVIVAIAAGATVLKGGVAAVFASMNAAITPTP